MNALFGLAAPKAANVAANATSGTLEAITRPFGQFFQSAINAEDAAAASESEELVQQAAALQEQIARRLQELLAAVGAASGDQASIRFDDVTGQFHVDGHHLAPAMERAIKNDSRLMADLQKLAELQSEFDPSISPRDWEVDVRLGDGATAELRWR